MPQKELKEKIIEILNDTGSFDIVYFGEKADQILELFAQEKQQEYKNGYNRCLKDQKLTGEKYQHLYL